MPQQIWTDFKEDEAELAVDPDIVIIGSVHRDIIARCNYQAQAALQHKTGEPYYTFPGGTALNIASQLAYLGHHSTMITALNQYTPQGRDLQQALEIDPRIDATAVENDHTLPDSAFIAFIDHQGEVKHSLSCVYLHQSGYLARRIRETEPHRYSWLILDGNLSPKQIRTSVANTEASRNRIVMSGSGDAKAAAFIALADSCPHVTLAATNRTEAIELTRLLNLPVPDGEVQQVLPELRQSLNAEMLSVSDGANGWILVHGLPSSPTLKLHPAPKAKGIVNTLGAGDALTAGLVHALITGQNPVASVTETVSLTLRSPYPSPIGQLYQLW